MPWNHCQATEILDTDACPECGIDKETWTVEIEVTRTFRLARPPALRVILLDDRERGVAYEPFRVALPDGRVIEDKLDEAGAARIVHSQAGECTITFPARSANGVVPYRAEDGEEPGSSSSSEDEGAAGGAPASEESEDGEDGEAGAEGEEGEEGEEEPQPPSFEREAIGRYRFELHRVLQLTLLDEQRGWPLRNASYALEDDEGTRYEGETDRHGRLDHGPVRGRWFALTVTVEIDPSLAVWRGGEQRYQPYGHVVGASEPEAFTATARAPAVLLEDAFLLLPVAGIPVVLRSQVREERQNPRWSTSRCRFGEVAELIFEARDLEDGDLVEFEIFEHDEGGEDDRVVLLTAPVREGEARAAWRMRFVDDSDDEPTEVDSETGFNLPEFVFVVRYGDDREARCEETLTFSTDLELPIEDAEGNSMPNTDYRLRCGQQVLNGQTDEEGVLRAEGVGPNFEIRLGDGREILIVGVEGEPA